jgi:hypothetical protein
MPVPEARILSATFATTKQFQSSLSTNAPKDHAAALQKPENSTRCMDPGEFTNLCNIPAVLHGGNARFPDHIWKSGKNRRNRKPLQPSESFQQAVQLLIYRPVNLVTKAFLQLIGR